MPLSKTLEIVDNTIKQLESVPWEIVVLTNSKLQKKIPGLNDVMSIRDLLLNKTQ